jgi:hypothetical protein
MGNLEKPEIEEKFQETAITILTLAIVKVIDAILKELEITDPEKKAHLQKVAGDVFDIEFKKLAGSKSLRA